MDNKKILFATLFVAIMLLIPFTTVGTQPIDYAEESEDDQILENASPSRHPIICKILDRLGNYFESKYSHWYYECLKEDFDPDCSACKKKDIYFYLWERNIDSHFTFDCYNCI